jgi:hypothetical protein
MMAKHDGPIEVWLSQKNLQVTCMVVYEDESTTNLGVDALSIRGGEREMTGYLISQGYKPVGRWQTEESSGYDDRGEVSRRFVPDKKAETDSQT